LVYVMGSAQWPYVKIGYSKDPRKRLWYVQVSCPVRLELLATYEGGRALEAALHRYFGQYRMNGEWFDLGEGAVATVDAAVELGLGLLTTQGSDLPRRSYALTPAVHPLTGRQFSPEHPEWFHPWPSLDERFPPIPGREAEKLAQSLATEADQGSCHYGEFPPAVHPLTGRQFSLEHPEWFQPWPSFDERFPPVRASGSAR
jgi:hypothetical protein